MSDNELVISRGDRPGASSLRLSGFLDAHTAPSLDRAIQDLVDNGCSRIVLNLAELDYISSAGLGVFMSYVEPLRAQGGDLKISNLMPRVQRVFDIVGFERIFDIFDQEDVAIADFDGTVE